MANILLKTVTGRIGTLVGGSVIALGLWVGLGGSMRAAPRAPDAQTCLPTCEIDGRSFVVAGNDPTTLSAQAITIALNYTNAEPLVNFEIYDADNLTNWDTSLQCGVGCADNNSPAPLLKLSLYRDPAADGTGVVPANLVATWTPGGVPGVIEQGPFAATNNSWSGDTVPQDPAAVGLDGDSHYALVIAPFSPATNKGWNAFKIRANGTVTLLGNQIVGFIGAMNPQFDLNTIYPNIFPNQTGTPYNGKWVFVTTLPSFLGDVTVFDGDMDFGNAACAYNDTNDPDSDPANPNSAFFPTGIPPFAIGSAAAAEGVAVASNPDPNIPTPLLCSPGPGVRTGTPAEDAVASSANLRVPTIVPNGIAYLLRAPDGQVFLNQNPSGNKEWEQFKIQKVKTAADIPSGACPAAGYPQSPGFTLPDNPNDNLYPASDCRTLALPGGNWQVELDGMDLQNLNFWFFSFKVEPPVTEYSIGRLVWYDDNANGVQDGLEVGAPGVTFTVYDGPLPGGNVVTAGVTNGTGEFLITPLAEGNYTVVVDATNFNAGGPLQGYTSTTGGETQNGIEVGLPVCTDTNVPVGCGQPVYDEALFGYDKPDVCVGTPKSVSLTSTTSSATDGPDGNTRLFDSNTMRASAWARNRTTGAWSQAWLGQYSSSGLGVTDNTEGDGSSNRHIVDNNGSENYVLFEFASPVTPDKVDLSFIQGDADISVWIGTKADAFTTSQTLSDAYLTSLGFTEVNDGSTSSGTRTADINAGTLSGNILIVSAQTGSETNDGFKISKLVLGCPGPSISIIKKTNGSDNDSGTGPLVTVGSTVTWTYIVTNTGNVALTGVAVTDDKVGAICTIGSLAIGASTTCTKTGTAVLGQYVNVGTVTGTPPSGPVVTATNPDRYFGQTEPCVPGSVALTSTSSSSTDGTDGNTRLFNNSTIRASAWARSRTSGTWSQAWLGLYSSSGLGVTDNSEGSGSNNRHIVDNNGGMENYVLLEFKTPVTVDKVGLSYIQGDADISVWIGTKADAFTTLQTLSDAYLISLGFTEVNDTSVSSGTRSADINAGNVSGNIVIIAAQTGSETNDGFKISSVTLSCPTPSAPAPASTPAPAPASAPEPALAPKSLWVPAPALVVTPR